jgi:hypothetical protein
MRETSYKDIETAQNLVAILGRVYEGFANSASKHNQDPLGQIILDAVRPYVSRDVWSSGDIPFHVLTYIAGEQANSEAINYRGSFRANTPASLELYGYHLHRAIGLAFSDLQTKVAYERQVNDMATVIIEKMMSLVSENFAAALKNKSPLIWYFKTAVTRICLQKLDNPEPELQPGEPKYTNLQLIEAGKIRAIESMRVVAAAIPPRGRNLAWYVPLDRIFWAPDRDTNLAIKFNAGLGLISQENQPLEKIQAMSDPTPPVDWLMNVRVNTAAPTVSATSLAGA